MVVNEYDEIVVGGGHNGFVRRRETGRSAAERSASQRAQAAIDDLQRMVRIVAAEG